MKPRAFVDQLGREEIVAAIREAEQRTSGEIRVFITRRGIQDPVAAAQRHFMEMGMTKTRERNAVLIFVAPRVHKFAVIGDTAVHARCGNEFWEVMAAEMSEHFRRLDFTRALVHGIQKAGELLAAHFPRQPGKRNELSDEIEED